MSSLMKVLAQSENAISTDIPTPSNPRRRGAGVPALITITTEVKKSSAPLAIISQKAIQVMVRINFVQTVRPNLDGFDGIKKLLLFG